MRKFNTWIKFISIQLLYLIVIVSSYFLFPIAYLLRDKINSKSNYFYQWLWVYLNDTPDGIFGPKWWSKQQSQEKGFVLAYKWSVLRNPAWNYWGLFKPKEGKKKLYEVIKSQLYREFNKVSHYEFAGLKWIDEDGNEGWSVNKGVAISEKYSTFGKAFIYYTIGNTLYFRLSFVKKVNNYYFTIRLGATNNRYTVYFKRQRE